MVSPHLRSSITDLLLDAGISAEEMEVAPLDGGANNKVFSVDNKKSKYLAKIYYSNPSDTHNRLNAEYSFNMRNIGLEWFQNHFFPTPKYGIV